MLKKITGYYARSEEMADFVREADEMITKYGWSGMTVAPYGWGMKVTRVVDELRCFDECTSGSKEYLVALANGLADIMNKWEERELTPKVRVRMLETGGEYDMYADLVDEFVRGGLVEVV